MYYIYALLSEQYPEHVLRGTYVPWCHIRRCMYWHRHTSADKNESTAVVIGTSSADKNESTAVVIRTRVVQIKQISRWTKNVILMTTSKSSGNMCTANSVVWLSPAVTLNRRKTSNPNSKPQSYTMLAPAGSDRVGSGRIGSARIGSDRVGSDRSGVGSDRIGSDLIGSDRLGSVRLGSDLFGVGE